MKTAQIKIKPLLKWVGGKFGQSEIISVLRNIYKPYREHHIYVEPFVGGMGSMMAVKPGRAYLNDSNPNLIRFYQAVRSGCQWQPEYKDFLEDQGYYSLRTIFNGELRSPYLTEDQFMTCFYLMNRAGYNGVWRVNSKGQVNTPEGKTKDSLSHVIKFPNLTPYRSILSTCSLTATDYSRFINYMTTQDRVFFYCDPPYDGTYSGYTKDSFNWQSQIDLATQLSLINQPVAVSNAATDRIINLYTELGFTVAFLKATRSVSCNGDRAKVNEMIATKNI